MVTLQREGQKSFLYYRPWPDAAHYAQCLIRAYDICLSMSHLFADDLTYVWYNLHCKIILDSVLCYALVICQGEKLEMVTTATVCLFSSQTSLLDQVPSLGYIPKVFLAMREKNNAIPKSALQVCHQLAHSEVKKPAAVANYCSKPTCVLG